MQFFDCSGMCDLYKTKPNTKKKGYEEETANFLSILTCVSLSYIYTHTVPVET